MSLRLAFLASGNGSTFQHLVETIQLEKLPAHAELLICSRPDAFAVERAKTLGIRSEIVSRKDFDSLEDHAAALLHALRESRCDVIFLAGYLEFVPTQVVEEFRDRIVNIHPALLPAFGGKGMYGHRVHEAVIAYGARVSGATVHFVDEHYDHGPIIAQQAVAVRPDDTPDSLAQRIQTIEKNLYAGVLRLICKEKLKVSGRKVTFLP
ncbi:MAG: phosphoribosylglycinamide formyltransferase [Calditrichaeota bacterium]|nr:phosphoribosylglycinamide formyltransferase [Calditrichota bacterium]MCB9391629.1 phosphoribosylglycinamide formyltransferase [Calditrichota bacterium]